MARAQTDLLLAEAQRHEAVAARLRDLAAKRHLDDEHLLTAPIVHGWTWDSVCLPAIRGNWLPVDGARGIVDGRLGPVVAHTADLAAVLTMDGWHLLGVPDDVRSRHEGGLQ